jgi:hypothetical protein
VPSFENYAEAWAFVEKQAKNYPSKGAYYASEEYKKFFPTLKALSDTHNVGLATKAKSAMKEAGVKDGACVEYLDANPWGIVFEYKGKVKLDKEGIPFVTLFEKTSDGRKRVRWHKGFQPIKCPTATKSKRK